MSDIPEIPDRPTTLPLDPMPIAPPDIAAAWMRRLATGALLGLILLAFGFCTSLLTASVPSFYETISVFVYPLSSVIGVVVLWLITSPEPGNPYWLVYLRWAARAGILIGLVEQIVHIGVLHSPLMTAEDFAAPYGLLILASSVGWVMGTWYDARLSGRLGDRVLQRNFGALKWISGVAVAGMVIYALVDWQGFCESNLKKLSSSSLYSAKSLMFGWVCFTLPLSAYFGWLQWRLWRRLRTTANRLREMGEGLPGEKLK